MDVTTKSDTVPDFTPVANHVAGLRAFNLNQFSVRTRKENCAHRRGEKVRYVENLNASKQSGAWFSQGRQFIDPFKMSGVGIGMPLQPAVTGSLCLRLPE